MSKNNNPRSSSGGHRNRTTPRGSSTSDRGARSKMEQQSAFNKASGAQGQLSKHITVLWKSVNFCFTEKNQASAAINFQESFRLDIGKVQFAITSSRKEKYIGILKRKGIQVYVNDKHQIEVKFLKEVNEINDKLKYLEKIFEEDIICDLDSNSIDAESPEGKKLIKELPIEMKKKAVSVYHCVDTKTLYVVKEKPEKQQMLLKQGNPDTPEFEKKLSLPDSFLLGYAGFEEHILNTFPDVEVDVTQHPPVCRVKSHGSNINIEEEIRRFRKKVKSRQLAVSGDLIERLFFNKYPEPNDAFYMYIKKRLKISFEKAFFYISKSDTGEFIVNCLNENEAQKVADMVEKSIVSEVVEVKWGEDGWNFLKEWSGKKKLFYINNSSGIELCCTTDVHKKFHQMKIQNDDQRLSLSLPDNQLKFLRLFGEDFLFDIERQFEIRATVKESELGLRGKLEKLQESASFLKSELRKYRKTIPLDVPIECLENKKDTIDREMNNAECVWNLNTIQKPLQMLKHCDYEASWIDHVRELKVTVVKGFSWHIDLDLQIVMTNQCLYPIETAQPEYKVPKDFILRGKSICERRPAKKVEVGEIIQFLEEIDGSENLSCVALVVKSDPNVEYKVDVKQRIKEILSQYMYNENINNFGISVPEGGQDQNRTRQTIEAALEFGDASPGQIKELFICCQTKPREELRIVNEILKEKRGFVMEIYSEPAKMLRCAVPDIKIKVIEGSLEQLKGDVMVNTTNSALKLDEGSVSSTILKLAGANIQKECKSKYPNGLKKGQVAKTKTYKLKNLKIIYHITLPDYNVTTFREDVKMYVKKCLCQAERDDCCSIVFPALGVGRLKYPRRETAVAMFDAAEEYSLGVINPVLKSIKFLVNVNDKMTYEAFRDEEYRRSKRCLSEIGLTKPFIKKDFKSLVFKTDQNNPLIKITTLQDFWVPPAYAIEIFIGYAKTEEKIYRKRAFDKPPSSNDRWFLHRAESTKIVAEDLRKLIKSLELDDRVTEIVIYTNKDSACNISEGEQADAIRCVFSTMHMVFLQEVIIVVSDESSLNKTAKLDGQLTLDRKNNHSQSTELSIELIGKTKEGLNDAETFVKNMVQTIKEEIISTVLSRLPKLEDTMDPLDSKNDFEVSDEVTAEINRGIVSFKKQNKDLDSWVSKVEKSFRLEVTVSSDGRGTMVKGGFDSILRFEEYLDKSFPDDPPAVYIL